MTPTNVEISIVTPTHRRPDLLERLLASLSAQATDLSRFDVAVVDDASGDDTPEVLGRWTSKIPNLRWTSFDAGRGPAAARNAGVAMSEGDLILFLDDDVECVPDLLDTHLAFHRQASDPNAGLLGRVDWHSGLDITPFMRWLDRSGLQFAYDTWLTPGPVDPAYGAFYTANLSMGRELFERSGGFDERFPYPAYEDMELAYRLHGMGFRMEYRPEALVYHTRAIDLPTFCRRMSKVAESAVVLGAVQPDFPLSKEHTPERWTVRSGWRRRLDQIRSRSTTDPSRLARHYRTEIAHAYEDGLARGRARLSERTSTNTA